MMTFPLIFMIREPKVKKLPNPEPVAKVNRMLTLTKEVMLEIRQKPKYIFVFICSMVSRLMNILFAVYVQLWVMSFQKSGVLASKEQSDKTYRDIVIWMQIATLTAMPIFGYYSDKGDPRIMIPLTFLARGTVACSFRFIDDPQTVEARLLAVCLTVTSIIQFLSVEVLFMRNMKSTIRGTLYGIAFFFGCAGSTLFVYVGGILFDKVAPWAPFMVVGVSDFAVIVFALVFIFFGLLKRDD